MPPETTEPTAPGRGVDLFFGEENDPQAAAAEASAESVAAYDQAVDGAYDTPPAAVEEANELAEVANMPAPVQTETAPANGAAPAAAIAAPTSQSAPPSNDAPPPVVKADSSGGGSSMGCLYAVIAMLVGALLGAILALGVLYASNQSLDYAPASEVAVLSQRVEEMESFSRALRSDVTALQSAAMNTQSELEKLGHNTEALAQNLTQLGEAQQSMATRLDELAALADALDGVKDQLAQTDTRVGAVEGAVSGVRSDVDTMASALISVTQQVEEVAVTARRAETFFAGMSSLLKSLYETDFAGGLPVTPTVRATDGITPSIEVTGTLPATLTEVLSPTATVTATLPVTATDALSPTAPVTSTVPLTATAEPEATPEASATPAAGAGVLNGVVFLDRNRDGIYDTTTEPGIAGVVVSLRIQGGTEVAQATTNFRGRFEFTDLAPGIYVVAETVPAGFSASTPTTLTARVTGSTPGQPLEFGNYR